MRKNSTSVPLAQPETRNTKRGRGAPAGNRNASKHGFYSKKNADHNREVLREHTDLGRADREVFLAAWQVNAIKLRDPSNERLQLRAVCKFLQSVQRRYGIIDPRDDDALDKALDAVAVELALPGDVMAVVLKELV